MSEVPKGHVKVARKSFDPEHGDPLWLEQREFSRWEAWVDVLQLAAFRDRKHVTKQETILLCRGEFVASLRWLADRWTWTVKKVRNWIATLEKWARLRAQRETTAGTVYLIVNYDRYQTTGADAEPQKGTPTGTDGAQQGHKKEAGKAVKQDQKLAGAPAPKLEVVHSWTAEGAAWWQETVGRMTPGHFGKVLKPAVEQHGWPAVKLALVRWVIEKQATNEKMRLEWFAAEWSRYLHLPEQPIIDEHGVLTPYGEKLTRAARYA